jgi:starch-binding outer membrane protein SusE/F
MRKNIYIIAFMLSLFAFVSCEKDWNNVMVSENPTASVQQGPAAPNGIAFTKADADKSIDFSWTAADFGYKASVYYGVQLSLTDNFAKSATILSTQALTGSAKVGDINGVLLGLGLEIGVPSSVKCRVFSTVGAGTDSVFSAATSYTVTAYETLIDYPMIYVPGNYQGWSPGAVNGRLFSYGFDNIYEGIIRVDGQGFKVTPKANWDNSWGGTLTASGKNYSGVLNPTGGDFTGVTAGCYAFKVNTTALTIDLKSTDDWGIIGSSIPPYDWSADVDMFYNGQRKMWEITGNFKAGVYKFRANNG